MQASMMDTGGNSSRRRARRASSTITPADHWDHCLARLGINRNGHRVEPGLYALGSPTRDSSVFVTANYTLSFDALRSALEGVDGHILVLDTNGVNVWCAAGKGTFGTAELVRRIEATSLRDAVSHRVLILPQLGAPGVSAHDVRRRSGFEVEYGPVQAADLPEYLNTRQATPEMRQVRFALRDRLVLIPVELVHVLIPMLIVGVALLFAVGPLEALSAVAASLAGVVLFPILLPWLPTIDFSSKGFLLGGLTMLPFAWMTYVLRPDAVWWRQTARTFAYLLTWTPVTAYLSLNFTGSTPFTSRSGVRREIFTYVPIMAWMFGIGIVLAVSSSLL